MIKITRARSLNAYINYLQGELSKRGKSNKLYKKIYLSSLSKSNTNNSLAAIKARAKANAKRIINST